MQIVVDDLLASYRRKGSGRVVVILHGWGDSSASFEKLMTELSDDFDVVALDLPGFGGTESPTGTWGIVEYSAFVGHFVTKLELSPYAIIGHSNGGTIAMHGLACGDYRAAKLLLFASAGVRDRDHRLKQLLGMAAKGAKVFIAPLPQRVQRRIKRRLYGAIGSDLFVVEHLQHTFRNVVRYDIVANARTLTTSTMLVYGADDTATPVSYGEVLRDAIPGSRLVVLADAGHFVFLDQPAECVRLVEEFLR